MSLEKHSNVCKVIEFVEENLDFKIVLERTGIFSCDTEIQVHLASAEKEVQALEVWN